PLVLVIHPVGTRGGVTGMWGPGACPRYLSKGETYARIYLSCSGLHNRVGWTVCLPRGRHAAHSRRAHRTRRRGRTRARARRKTQEGVSIMPAKEETNGPATTRKNVAPKERTYKQSVIILVIGDVICFLIFSVIGDQSHGKLTGLASIPHIILITLPFLAAWFIVSPFVGAFRQDVIAQPRLMAIRTATAWLLSWPVALLLRGI